MTAAARQSVRLAGILLASALAVPGCGVPKTTVMGTVTYQGKPVVWGNVSLVASDGLTYGGEIREDGTYSIPDVPVGPCKIGVNSPNPAGRAAAKRPEMKGAFEAAPGPPPGAEPDTRPKPPPGKWFPIADTYMDPLKSGLTGEVKAGQPLHVEIK